MIGYIYVTKTQCGGVYVGQHKSSSFDTNYTGSGVLLKRKKIVSCKMIDLADDIETLNDKEKYWIEKCFKKYGDKCLNIARGGGNTFKIVYVHLPTKIGYRDIEDVQMLTLQTKNTIHKWMNTMKGAPPAYRKRKTYLKPHQLILLRDWVKMDYKTAYKNKTIVIK